MLNFEPNISRMITAHRRRRRRTMSLATLIQARNGRGLMARGLGFGHRAAQWLERRARRRLIDAIPANSTDAAEKLRYLMALLIAGGADLHAEDIKTVVATLRQFPLEMRALLERDMSSKDFELPVQEMT